MPDFQLVGIGASSIEVRHMSEGHNYSFVYALGTDGRRLLSQTSYVRINQETTVNERRWYREAYAFAQSEALRAGRIDQKP